MARKLAHEQSDGADSTSDTGDKWSLNRRNYMQLGAAAFTTALGSGLAGAVSDDAVNIQDHGAEPNPDDPNPESAKQNLDALHDAAHAAGEGGTIYVPSGTYYFGHDGSGVINLTLFGPREPAGISVIGDGPETSTLAVTEHLPDDNNHNALIWQEDYDHGTVQISNIRLDGNYENLGDLQANNTGSRACVFKGQGTLNLTNAWLRGWYTNGIYFKGDVSGTVEYCTLEENGVGLENDSGGTTVSHHISVSPSADGNAVTVDHCEFKHGAGQAVNIRSSDVDVTVKNCYGEGLGVGVFKISAGSTIKLQNSYMQPNNDWVESNLTDDGDFHGRYVVHRLDDRISSTPTVVLDNVELRSCTYYTIHTRDHPLEVQGDMIAMHNSALDEDRDAAIRDDADGELTNVDINRISVHDTDGAVFNAPNADGTIETLRRNDDLGDTGDLSLSTDNSGADPFEPDVVSQDEVGINADTTNGAPSVSWQSPSDGETVNGSITVQIAASDSEDSDDSLEVTYNVDGGSARSTTYNSDSGYYEETWDTTDLADGEHTLEANATDSGGATSSSSITVTTDNAGSPPVVDNLSLTEVETSSSDAEFDADWTVSDEDGDLDSLDLTLTDETDGGTEDSATVSASGSSDSGTSRLVAAGDDGSGNDYTVDATVTDGVGNTGSGSTAVSETEDSNAPVINRFSVSEAQRPDPHAEITVVWDVSDADGDLAFVDIDITDSGEPVQGVTWSLSGSSASDTDSFKIKDGDGTTFDVTLTVTDEADQSTSQTKSMTA